MHGSLSAEELAVQSGATTIRAQNAASCTCGCSCSLLSGATGSIVPGISNLPHNRTLRRKSVYLVCAHWPHACVLHSCPTCPLQSGYHTCTYKYHATQRNFDREELQVTEVQAIVHISCYSGEFNVAIAPPKF